jgi:hypothetical protein
MLLAALSSIVMLQAAAVPAALDPAHERLKARAEACIQTNASRVERNEPSLNDAVLFLVNNLCALELGTLQKYESNSTLLTTMRAGQAPDGSGWTIDPPASTSPADLRIQRERAIAVYKDARIDPDTGALVFPGKAPDDQTYMIFIQSLGGEIDRGSQEFRSLAARAVLNARQSRLAH